MEGKICAVIPAAGKGIRLGLTTPKILVSFDNRCKIIDILLESLNDHVEKILIIVSAESKALIQDEIERKNRSGFLQEGVVELVIQKHQDGMGDAVFCAYDIWKDYENIIIIWGDQASLSKRTVRRTITMQLRSSAPCFTIPLVRKNELYVEYLVNAGGALEGILQKREGDRLHERGYSDVAIFSLATKSVLPLWELYLRETQKGRVTKEINFLPFLVFLSRNGWKTNIVHVNDPFQAFGLNTPDDFEYLARRLKRRHTI